MNNYCLLILPYISGVFLILYIHFSNHSVLNERKLHIRRQVEKFNSLHAQFFFFFKAVAYVNRCLFSPHVPSCAEREEMAVIRR